MHPFVLTWLQAKVTNVPVHSPAPGEEFSLAVPAWLQAAWEYAQANLPYFTGALVASLIMSVVLGILARRRERRVQKLAWRELDRPLAGYDYADADVDAEHACTAGSAIEETATPAPQPVQPPADPRLHYAAPPGSPERALQESMLAAMTLGDAQIRLEQPVPTAGPIAPASLPRLRAEDRPIVFDPTHGTLYGGTYTVHQVEQMLCEVPVFDHRSLGWIPPEIRADPTLVRVYQARLREIPYDDRAALLAQGGMEAVRAVALRLARADLAAIVDRAVTAATGGSDPVAKETHG